MRKIIYFIAFFLIIGIISAQDFNDYRNLEIESKFSSKLKLDFVEQDYKLDYIIVNLTFFPRSNEFQSVTHQWTGNPNATISKDENSILYKWDNPKNNELGYELNSKIKSQVNFKKIKEKIKFPLENIEGLESYTKEGETITSKDPIIIKKASELAQGEDDMYKVVHKIGLWTKENINYSLETLTEGVSQNASWVLENKKGVCDELTSLFVAMLRSINIPARFVTGQAYTNVVNEFGNHAWAEVYFPSYGWIPFDPTYGQLGYTDSSHIIMRNSVDIKEPSVDYIWRSYGVEINSSKLNVKSNVTNKGELYKENVILNLDFLEEEVGPGSYVPLQVELKNPNEYYLPLSLDITKAPKEIEDKEKQILLKPGQTKRVFFIIEIQKDLDQGFIYTSEVEIKDNFNHSWSKDIKFSKEYGTYTLKEAQNKISQLEEEDKKVYSANLSIECNKDKSFYYSYENISASCIIKNSGNLNLKDLNLCYNNLCSKINLNIGESKEFDINLRAGDTKKELLIKAENPEVSKNLFLDLNILKMPNLTIKSLNYPQKASYNKDYEMSFTLNSDSEAKNVLVKLGNNQVFNLDLFKGVNDFNINFKGKSFYNKKLNLEINYKDMNNKTYSLSQPIEIQVENIPFYIEYDWLVIIILIIIILALILSKTLRNKLSH